jgi:hypothetical protein
MAPELGLQDALPKENDIPARLKSQLALLLRIGELYHPLAVAHV